MHFDLPQDTALISEPPVIRVQGLRPQEITTIQAEATDRHGEVWRSRATFEASASGTLNLASAVPISGSYTAPDANGLIWSMCPRADLANAFFETPDTGFVVQFSLERAGTSIERTRLVRLAQDPQLTRTEVREAGLVGTLFTPPGPVHAGALLLGGSEGGLHESRAALLASHGFLVLALAYFGLPGTPAQLINLPLETFECALCWLRARPEVGGRRVGVTGSSKGGEAALLIAATYPEHVGAVAAIVPSGLVWQGIDRGGSHPPGEPMSSWSLGGQPLPYIPYRVRDWGEYFSKPGLGLTPAHQQALESCDVATLAAATIPVERIRGPVLLVSGGDDGVWPSHDLALIAQRRLEAHGLEVEHLTDPGAGHALSVPGFPTLIRTEYGRMGGIPEADARVQAHAWARTLAVLSRA